MKIKVIKCSSPFYWYSLHIGKTFDVHKIQVDIGEENFEMKDVYGVIEDSTRHVIYYFDIEDCELLKED